MPGYIIKRLIILGFLAISGIIFIQGYWMYKSWSLQDEEFDLTVSTSLRKVAEFVAKFNQSELPKQNLIQRRSSNYYSVNINSAIDANILEHYLIQEFEKRSLNTDFEYAVYDCANDDLVYGNYCKMNSLEGGLEPSTSLPKFSDLTYYFVVKFPFRESYLLSNIKQAVLFSVISLLACLFFAYSIIVILRQKRLSVMQKEFINNMTHEFKTPLSSIKIAAEVLSNHTAIKEDNRLSKYSHIIKEQNERLNKQVEKVLNIARIENHQFAFKKEIFGLNDTIEALLKNEQAKIHENNVRIQRDLDDSIGNIEADKLHFSNLFSNIIDNAIKYGKGEGVIAVTTKQLLGKIELRIKDNGIGISKENLKRVFDKFYRVSTGNVHNVKGFGLGLFYVKNICDAHGWDIDIKSDEGIGTELVISIKN